MNYLILEFQVGMAGDKESTSSENLTQDFFFVKGVVAY